MQVMTGFSSHTILTTVFLKENDILLSIKSCYSFLKQIHPAIDKSEGLHKVVTWPGYEKKLGFSWNTKHTNSFKNYRYNLNLNLEN